MPLSPSFEHVIGMPEMHAIFEVTDAYGISREAVSVPLEKTDPGGVARVGSELEITVPASEPLEVFAERLRRDLESLGYRWVEDDG